MPGIQNCNCLIHTIQVVPHSLFTPGVQLLVQENGTLGASLLGIAELQVTLCVGDEFLGNRIGFFCCFITEYRLWLQEEKCKFENRLSIIYCLMFGYLTSQTARWIYRWICQKTHKSGTSDTATGTYFLRNTVYVSRPHYILMHLWKQQLEF